MITFKSYLTELPHILYNDVFDLEMEKFNKKDGSFDKNGFLNKLTDIFSGKVTIKDKYNNIILLKSDEQKQLFYDSLKDNFIFMNKMKELGINIDQIFKNS